MNTVLDDIQALADRWQAVLDECKDNDPRWILDRSVMTLDSCLQELRHTISRGF